MYFLSNSNVDDFILNCLTDPPLTGSRLESGKSSGVSLMLKSVTSKFPPVRFPAVEEYLKMYSAALSSESILFPGAVNSTVTVSVVISTIVRSVT